MHKIDGILLVIPSHENAVCR